MQQHSRLKRFEGTASCFSLILNHRLPQYRLLENRISFFQITCSVCCCCSVANWCPIICDPMNCSTLVFPVLPYFPEFAQTHVHWVGDAIQPSHPLSSPSPTALNLSQHQGLFQWVSSSHQVARVSECQLQHRSFPMNTQDWFPLGWTGWISLQSKGLSRVFPSTTVQKASILQRSAFFMI